jgi:glycosyltransferase involved in cell wall biosynthesis
MIKHSIIIPTASRPIAIRGAIKSVLEKILDSTDTELIIVDNNTDEELSQDLKNYCMKLSHKLRYVYEPSPGLSAARHRGAEVALGDLLTFLDDDVEISDSWLSAVRNSFVNPGVVMVGGPSIPKFTCSIPDWFWIFIIRTNYGGWMNEWLSLLDIGQDVPNIDPNYIWGLNFSIRKQTMYDCGGFHPDLVPTYLQCWQGDGETGLTKKIKKKKLRADYCQAALVYHICGQERLNVNYFEKRGFYQGVCASYSKIRQIKDARIYSIFFYKFKLRMSFFFRYFFYKLVNFRSNKLEKEVIKLIRKSCEAGFLFHQQAVISNGDLISWILRTNYFNADLRNFDKKNFMSHHKQN